MWVVILVPSFGQSDFVHRHSIRIVYVHMWQISHGVIQQGIAKVEAFFPQQQCAERVFNTQKAILKDKVARATKGQE
jgi:hypothetical protein